VPLSWKLLVTGPPGHRVCRGSSVVHGALDTASLRRANHAMGRATDCDNTQQIERRRKNGTTTGPQDSPVLRVISPHRIPHRTIEMEHEQICSEAPCYGSFASHLPLKTAWVGRRHRCAVTTKFLRSLVLDRWDGRNPGRPRTVVPSAGRTRASGTRHDVVGSLIISAMRVAKV
jgi:hypothetical protein